jgi:hypothetical protein
MAKKKKAKPIQWGKDARPIKFADICRGDAQVGKKRDLHGWIIEFFGENTRAAIAFERHFAEKINIPAHFLELWSDDATIKEQVKLFNETLEELKVPISKKPINKKGKCKK